MLKIESKIFEASFNNDHERQNANDEISKQMSEYLSFFKDAIVDYNTSSSVFSFQSTFILHVVIVLRHRENLEKTWQS